MRCPLCRYPLEDGAKVCGHCGVLLWTTCNNCGKETFLGDKCSNCGAPIVIACPNPKCRTLQSPASKNCIKCGKPLR
ncbi:hypothetical protein MSBR2_0526 [Methanosarcina barkeri 227]|uniref:DZANK-type domain-containing protein n=3 Tax=Methanosarcina TaxID=2207 RepID=A0A0E3QW35_METBA|nr:zinc ribbon domain-containing protein [Methanosarcina barkeri]AKB54879.1 hypothetical protein MSBRM_1881 [Methanosarcina barkeri MS]AKB57042.1 hypothetical protein MSBR2_0526 [Methanosarcina barkeri 227]